MQVWMQCGVRASQAVRIKNLHYCIYLRVMKDETLTADE